MEEQSSLKAKMKQLSAGSSSSRCSSSLEALSPAAGCRSQTSGALLSACWGISDLSPRHARTHTYTHTRARIHAGPPHCRLLERLAEERACALTLAEGRREVIEVRQRDGSFFADEGGGFNALLRYYGVCVF